MLSSCFPATCFFTCYKLQIRQLWVRPIEWLILNFESCVIRRTRLFYISLLSVFRNLIAAGMYYWPRFKLLLILGSRITSIWCRHRYILWYHTMCMSVICFISQMLDAIFLVLAPLPQVRPDRKPCKYMRRYAGHVISAIEKSDLDQVLSRKRLRLRWTPPFGALIAGRALPRSPDHESSGLDRAHVVSLWRVLFSCFCIFF